MAAEAPAPAGPAAAVAAAAVPGSAAFEAVAVNLSLRCEGRLLDGAFAPAAAAPVPCVLIVGCLGAGKTSLLSCLLAKRGSLRLAVLACEAAAIDIDSRLLGAAAHSAALGLPRPDAALSGVAAPDGGAAASPALLAAQVRRLLASAAGVGGAAPPPDGLLIEASGVADPQALATALCGAGVRLDAVVAVVNAEQAADAAAAASSGRAGGTCDSDPSLALLRLQLASADRVLLNKTDLVTQMSRLSGAEDWCEREARGATVLRCRYGDVPLAAVLDMQIEEAAEQPGSGLLGAAAFLSHEPVAMRLVRAARLGEDTQRHRARAAVGGGEVEDASALGPSGSISAFATAAARNESALSLPTFARWVRSRLAPTPGLLRAKGFVHFAGHPSRAIFHLAGPRRLDLRFEATAWEAPPACELVLIGTDRPAVEALAAEFTVGMVGERESGAPAHSDALGLSSALAAAVQLADRIAADERFASAPVVGPGPLLCLCVRGNSVHGVSHEGLNRDLAAAYHASRGPGLLVGLMPRVPAVVGGLTALCWVLPGEGELEASWVALDEALKPVLARGFAGVHVNCRCTL